MGCGRPALTKKGKERKAKKVYQLKPTKEEISVVYGGAIAKLERGSSILGERAAEGL